MKLKTVGFRVPLLNTSKVRTLNVDSVVNRPSGRALQETNARLMRRNPWCVHCAREGHQVLAAEFDHIVPLADGGADTDENKQGLCIPHHRAKSAAEHAARYGTLPGLA